MFRTYIETPDTNRTVLNQTETTLNFLKNTKICSILNCFGWSSVCFGQTKHRKSLFRYRIRNNRNKLFRNKPKRTETTRNNTKFYEKIPIYVLYQTVLVGLLFVSVQSKHRNSLFRYRSETTETNILFRIVPKLVSVPVSVVSNRN